MDSNKNESSVIFSNKAKKENNTIFLLISPFIYKDGRKPRLPRIRSDGYNLKEDTTSFFDYAFSDLENVNCKSKKYSVEIIVYRGSDRLGSADLDNYTKVILDGITHSSKVWKDDKQVDKLVVKRKYSAEEKSKITLKIKELML
ncbi:MAG: RusA family crossover junction endodeoxyribonuclease [Bacteroidales bacterium]|nr:RusA family crossover junction endodeoxyribonuclease [Bacteroidales bacterium]